MPKLTNIVQSLSERYWDISIAASSAWISFRGWLSPAYRERAEQESWKATFEFYEQNKGDIVLGLAREAIDFPITDNGANMAVGILFIQLMDYVGVTYLGKRPLMETESEYLPTLKRAFDHLGEFEPFWFKKKEEDIDKALQLYPFMEVGYGLSRKMFELVGDVPLRKRMMDLETRMVEVVKELEQHHGYKRQIEYKFATNS